MVKGFAHQFTNSVSRNGANAPACRDDLAKIDLHHDGIHHEEEADGNRCRHHRRSPDIERHAVETASKPRCHSTQSDPGDHAEKYPDRQEALESVYLTICR